MSQTLPYHDDKIRVDYSKDSADRKKRASSLNVSRSMPQKKFFELFNEN